MRRGIVVAIALVTLLSSCNGRVLGQERLLFEADDPVGDDYGPGSYTYPSNPAFAPYRGLFDLTRFRVLYDDRNVYFEITMAELTNPWNAPEGFSHPLIHIYIDTTPNAGRVDTLREGAYVRFDQRYAWDVCVRVVGWGGSRVYLACDSPSSEGVAGGLMVATLPDGKTIRASVPRALVGDLGDPGELWHYYVLVGSQDGYGPDSFRPVMERAGAWVFGGGSDLDINPNIIDILAPASGMHSQERQLGSWSEADRRLALLVPYNADITLGSAGAMVLRITVYFVAGLAALGMLGVVVLYALKRRGAK